MKFQSPTGIAYGRSLNNSNMMLCLKSFTLVTQREVFSYHERNGYTLIRIAMS